MSVKLHSAIAGQKVGSEYTGPMEAWLVVNGYASDSTSTNKVDVTGVPASQDPTLAANREAPREGLKVLGRALDGPDETPHDERAQANPQPVVERPFIGDELDKDSKAQLEKQDGRVDKVSEAKPGPQKRAESAADSAAGTGDNLHDEPTEDKAPIKDAPTGESAPARRVKASRKD